MTDITASPPKAAASKAPKKQHSAFRVLGEYWRQVSRFQLWGWLCFSIYLVSDVLISLVAPYVFKVLVDVISADVPIDVEHMGLWFWLFAAVTIGIMVFRRLGDFAIITFQLLAQRSLSMYSFSRLLKHSHHFFANEFVGGLVSKHERFVRGFERLHDLITYNGIPAVIALVGGIVIIFPELPELALGLVLWSMVYLAITWKLSRYKMRFDLKAAKAYSNAKSYLADATTNTHNIRAFSGSHFEQQAYQRSANRLYLTRFRAWWFYNWVMVFQGFATSILQLIGLWFALQALESGIATAGTVVLVHMVLKNVSDRLWQLGVSMADYTQSVSESEEMVAIIQRPVDVQDPLEPKPVSMSEGRIEFDNVAFYYDAKSPIYHGLSLVVPAGQRVGIVGPSGGGKSTLFNLIMRSMDVTAGEIRIDGQDIRDVTQDDLHQVMSYVPQDAVLFHRSLIHNIQYAKPDATFAEVVQAAKQANAHDFIMSQEKGYYTKVGERGIKLSGGERQRIAIARAMLKDAPILLLDEATSSLDSISEAQIQQQLDGLMKGRTTLAIAHRISTIQAMDRILVVEDGRIVEDGSHDTLLRQQGVYADLWSRQSAGFIQD